MNSTALFPGLLGESFKSLHPHVKAVHGGKSRQWSGRAIVQRGSNLLLRIAAAVAHLPSSQHDAPTVVTIEARDGREIWERKFGGASPMRSTLRADGGLLREQLGLVTLTFRIAARDGRMIWELRHISLCGLPLPRRWFAVQARADSSDRGYRFFVAVGVAGLGDLIRYEGELDVAG